VSSNPFAAILGIDPADEETRQPRDLPEPESLGFGKRLANALVGSKVRGLSVFGEPADEARVNVEELTPEERAQFEKLPKVKQVYLASKRPGGLVELSQNERLWNALMQEEPTMLQELVGYTTELAKDAPNEVKVPLYQRTLSVMEEGGYLEPGTADITGQLLALDQINDEEMADGMRIAVDPKIPSNMRAAMLEEWMFNRTNKRAKMEADLALTRQQTSTSRASERSTIATAVDTERGDAYLLQGPNGETWQGYEGDPEFRAKLASGWRGFRVGTVGLGSDGTASGTGLPFTKGDASTAASGFGEAVQARSRLESIISTFQNPEYDVTGWQGLVRELGPDFAALPGARFIIEGTTGMDPAKLSEFKTQVQVHNFQMAKPIIDEPRVTDEEREKQTKITSPRSTDSQEVVDGRNREIFHYLTMNADKKLFISTGRFMYDVTNDDTAVANSEAQRFLDDYETRGGYSRLDEKTGGRVPLEQDALEALRSMVRNQDELRRLGQATVRKMQGAAGAL
jgi:hypothetical protein